MPGTQGRSIHKLSAPRLFGIVSSLSKRNGIQYERRASRSSDTASWLRPFPQDGETFLTSLHPDRRKLICVAYEQFMLPCVGPEGRHAINWLPYSMLSGRLVFWDVIRRAHWQSEVAGQDYAKAPLDKNNTIYFCNMIKILKRQIII